MTDRTERITAALDNVRAKMDAKDALIATLTAARDKLQAFIDVTEWGTLDTGAEINAGDIVRYGALKYSARIDHTKALTRSPLNLVYWSVITDDEEAAE